MMLILKVLTSVIHLGFLLEEVVEETLWNSQLTGSVGKMAAKMTFCVVTGHWGGEGIHVDTIQSLSTSFKLLSQDS